MLNIAICNRSKHQLLVRIDESKVYMNKSELFLSVEQLRQTF